MLVYLQAPDAAAKTVALLDEAPTQEEQIDYARALRVLKTGWTPELRAGVLLLVPEGGRSSRAATASAASSSNIRRDAMANLSEAEKAELKPILEARPARPHGRRRGRPAVRQELDARRAGPDGRDRASRGATSTAAATSSPPPSASPATASTTRAAALGPDLSGVAGRFSARDLLESIVVPSKAISDQYEAVIDRHDRRPGRHRPDRQPPRRQHDDLSPTCSTRAAWSTSTAARSRR